MRRNARLVGEYPSAELPQLNLVEKMIGKELEVLEGIEEQPKREVAALEEGTPLVAVSDLGRSGAVAPFSLTIHAGEVVGLAGLLGSGRTEVARLLFGADRPDRGEVSVDGRPSGLRTPAQAIGHGIGFCSENRRAMASWRISVRGTCSWPAGRPRWRGPPPAARTRGR